MQSQPVVFSYQNWSARYPELAASVNSVQAGMFFMEAQLYCDNTCTSIIDNCPPAFARATFLNQLTAHIAALNAPLANPVNGQVTPSSPLVGRIATATEGSVTVNTDNQFPPGTPQWYQQTKYGAAFWAATTKYRTMRYVPGPRNVPNPWQGGYPFGGFNGFGRK
jgi:hypothetical protein